MQQPYQATYATDPLALEELARAARASSLRPKKIEHTLEWLARSEHGLGTSPGAVGFLQGGRLAGYVPLRLRTWRLPLRLGEVEVLAVPYTIVQLFGEAVLGDDGDALAASALDALAKLPYHYHALSLEETPTSSPLWRAIEAGRATEFVAVERGLSMHRVVDLPGSVDEHYARFSSKTRNTLKRRLRQLAERFPPVELRIYTRREEVDALLAAVEPVVTRTYHYRLLGQNLTRANQTLAKNLATCAEGGWLRGYVLFASGRPVAYVIGFLVERRFHYEMVGYDPDLASHAPGIVLLEHLLEDLIRTGTADLVDFGAGDADYKRLFGTRAWEEGDMLLVRRTPYALAMARLERLFAATSRRAVAVLARYGIKDRMKRAIRRADFLRPRRSLP